MSDEFRHGPLHVSRSGPPNAGVAIVLHGWGSSAAIMRPIAKMLDDGACVLNVDLPGHGKAPIPATALGIEEHAAAVDSLIREHSTAPVPIVGHSNGGRVALWMASHPEMKTRIARLALISPSGTRRRRSPSYYVKRSIAELLKAPFRIPPEPIRSACMDWLRHSLIWKALGSSDYRSLDGTMRATFVQLVNTYLEERLGDIEAPTLLLWGEKDPAISQSQIECLENGIPDAGVFALPGAGHFGFLDQPRLVRAALREFLDLEA